MKRSRYATKEYGVHLGLSDNGEVGMNHHSLIFVITVIVVCGDIVEM